jgi:serine O-acetyltransferase
LTIRQSLTLFASDVERYRMRKRSRLLVVLFTQGLWAAAVLRMVHPLVTSRRWLVRQAGRAAGLVLGKLVEVTAGIQLPPECRIGEGLYIGHFGNIIVNPRVRMGSNCNLSQGVTIGSAGRGERAEGVPVLGNRVWIGPGAVLFGPITIGDDVAIGANSVVTRSVPARAVAVGVPARIISWNGSFDYVSYRGMENDPERMESLAQRGVELCPPVMS